MKVLLMDLDTISRRRTYPNLALMKLASFHKAKGDEVFLNFPLIQAELAYASCVFSWNAKRAVGLTPNFILGGSGINLTASLPSEIEHRMPDYSLFPNVNFSLGFTSRGCVRRCPWCIVPEKEGAIKAAARIYEFWDRRHKRLILLDNNLLASPNWRQTMEDLLAEKLEVDFNQGLDIRLLNDKNVAYLKRLKIEQLRFAFDDIACEKAVKKGIELLVDNGISTRKLSFYVLVGFPGDDTAIERMKILKSYDVDVYPMIYKDSTGKEPIINERLSEIIYWHGTRGNLRKFLRLMKRI